MRLVQVEVKNTKMLKRYGHGAAALNVSSECVEVILCGGLDKSVSDTAVLRFGELK